MPMRRSMPVCSPLLDRRATSRSGGNHLWRFPLATLALLALIDFSCLAQSSTTSEARQQQANPPSRPSYRPDRSEEDWSILRDTSLRTDLWDSIKYIPLGHQDWYLSLGGEVRPFGDEVLLGAVPMEDMNLVVCPATAV
jgi:hypothetical protein